MNLYLLLRTVHVALTDHELSFFLVFRKSRRLRDLVGPELWSVPQTWSIHWIDCDFTDHLQLNLSRTDVDMLQCLVSKHSTLQYHSLPLLINKSQPEPEDSLVRYSFPSADAGEEEETWGVHALKQASFASTLLVDEISLCLVM